MKQVYSIILALSIFTVFNLYYFILGMNELSQLFFLIVIIPSAIIHEYMHGWMADRLGDPTARYAGRLSLNPVVHIDPIGTLLLPFILFISTGGSFLFAYAKPVPYNPYNLRNQKWGPVLVAFAGPAANLVLAAVFGVIVQLMPTGGLAELLALIVYANVLLAIFNLVPIPPLDGSKLLYALLPDSMVGVRQFLDKYGWIILLLFIFQFFYLIQPIIIFFFALFTGGIGVF